jgi:ubiquinone biosynthesis protein UbiJ
MLKKDLSIIYYINKLFQSEAFLKSIPDNFFNDIDGKIVKINLKDLPYNLMIKINDNALLLTEDEDKFDVELIASPVILGMFIITKGSEQFSSKISINGDIDTANKFNQFISSSKKLQELASNVLGENLASNLEEKFSKTILSLQGMFKESTSDIIDLLTDDLNVIPTKYDVNKFLDDVDDLKSRTDKLYKKYSYDK